MSNQPTFTLILVWILMECAGVLNKQKRIKLEKVLQRKERKGVLFSEEEKIFAALKIYPDSKKERRKFLKKMLIKWEKELTSGNLSS